MGQVAKAETTPFTLPAAPQEEAVPKLKLLTEKTDITVKKKKGQKNQAQLLLFSSDGYNCSSVSWEVGLPLQGDPWASHKPPQISSC